MSLSPNKRIIINFLATYGRSVFGIVCGIISGRWALMALGEVDYGLLGLIGGCVSFVTFFNAVLSGSVSRYYAISIGQAQKDEVNGLEACRQWFNTALLVHTVIPIILIIIGYPIGIHAINNWLTIPTDRIYACCWLWRFTCISCFLGMISVPWNGFYYAKQMIAELTVYSFFTNGVNVVFLYYIVNHKGDWLIAEGAWLCIIAVVPNILISIRALLTFPECQFRKEYIWSPHRLKQLFSYCGWQMFGSMGGLLRDQGMAVLVNKYFGPSANASMTLANHISGKTVILSSSFIGALGPAIANACGAKDYVRMRKLAFTCSKFGTVMTLLFIVPIAAELPLIVQYWLKNPPQYVVGLCWCVMATLVIDQSSLGHMLAVNANGKIALYQFVLGTFLMLTLPIAWILIALNIGGLYAIGYGALMGTLMCASGRVLFARYLVGMSIIDWALQLLLPVLILTSVAILFSFVPQWFIAPSVLRVMLSAFLGEMIFVLLGWKLFFNKEERSYLIKRLQPLIAHFIRS